MQPARAASHWPIMATSGRGPAQVVNASLLAATDDGAGAERKQAASAATASARARIDLRVGFMAFGSFGAEGTGSSRARRCGQRAHLALCFRPETCRA